MIKLLIIDDSPLMRKLLVEIFNQAGDFEVAVARNGSEALDEIYKFKPDVITLDIHMPGMDGLACLDQIMVDRPTPVVMLSSLTDEGAEETLEALSLGAVDFIAKPRGPISLEIDTIAPALIEKIRAASRAKLSKAIRLTDRIRQSSSKRSRSPVQTTPSKLRGRQSERLKKIDAILVGISTGGPPALDILLRPLPSGFPWPIVIAQHMPASFTGPLARRLDRNCALAVVEADRTLPLAPGHVYIGRGDADLIVSVRNGTPVILPVPASGDVPWHPSVDRLVMSAIETFEPEHLIGVLMTGMGSDGAKSMARLRQMGGRVIAQDAETSVVWGMPGALAALDGADQVLALHDIPLRLSDWSLE